MDGGEGGLEGVGGWDVSERGVGGWGGVEGEWEVGERGGV